MHTIIGSPCWSQNTIHCVPRVQILQSKKTRQARRCGCVRRSLSTSATTTPSAPSPSFTWSKDTALRLGTLSRCSFHTFAYLAAELESENVQITLKLKVGFQEDSVPFPCSQYLRLQNLLPKGLVRTCSSRLQAFCISECKSKDR